MNIITLLLDKIDSLNESRDSMKIIQFKVYDDTNKVIPYSGYQVVVFMCEEIDKFPYIDCIVKTTNYIYLFKLVEKRYTINEISLNSGLTLNHFPDNVDEHTCYTTRQLLINQINHYITKTKPNINVISVNITNTKETITFGIVTTNSVSEIINNDLITQKFVNKFEYLLPESKYSFIIVEYISNDFRKVNTVVDIRSK